MVNVLRGGVRPITFLLREANGSRSRDNLTIASGNTVKPGEVCSIVTATGQVVPLNAAGADGSETAAVIPLYGYDAENAAVMGAFASRDCEVIEDALIWPNGISAGDKASAIADLAARGIIIRPRSYVG